jgi:hypothetical protein
LKIKYIQKKITTIRHYHPLFPASYPSAMLPAVVRTAARPVAAAGHASSLLKTTTTRVVLPTPLARGLSSESERVHGKLDASQVTSKAMRKQLARNQAAEDVKSGKAVANSPPPPPPPVDYQHQQHQQQPQYYSYQPESFGQMWWRNMKSGFAVGLGVILVLVILKSVGLEGASSASHGDGGRMEECGNGKCGGSNSNNADGSVRENQGFVARQAEQGTRTVL